VDERGAETCGFLVVVVVVVERRRVLSELVDTF
jgi:hypothetical protein